MLVLQLMVGFVKIIEFLLVIFFLMMSFFLYPFLISYQCFVGEFMFSVQNDSLDFSWHIDLSKSTCS